MNSILLYHILRFPSIGFDGISGASFPSFFAEIGLQKRKKCDKIMM
jgi:hypothetical protein